MQYNEMKLTKVKPGALEKSPSEGDIRSNLSSKVSGHLYENHTT